MTAGGVAPTSQGRPRMVATAAAERLKEGSAPRAFGRGRASLPAPGVLPSGPRSMGVGDGLVILGPPLCTPRRPHHHHCQLLPALPQTPGLHLCSQGCSWVVNCRPALCRDGCCSAAQLSPTAEISNVGGAQHPL